MAPVLARVRRRASRGFSRCARRLLVDELSGLFFHSTSGGIALPFHGGFLCVKSPTKRYPVQNSGGTTGTCTGSFGEDLNAYIANGIDPALTVGIHVWIQHWSRDIGDPFGDGFTAAVTAVICP